MSLNEQFQFFLPMQFYHHRLLGFPTKPKKILEPKINPPPHPQPNFQALISKPWNFREGLNDTARQKIESNCLWFVYQSYHLPNLSFLIWQSELHGQHCTRAVLHQFLLKSRYHKTFIYICICQNFLSPKKSTSEKFQNKKRNTFIILVTLTLPSPSNPRLKPGIESNIIVCAVLFGSG